MQWLLKLMMEVISNGSWDGVMVMHSIMNEEVRPRASVFVLRLEYSKMGFSRNLNSDMWASNPFLKKNPALT